MRGRLAGGAGIGAGRSSQPVPVPVLVSASLLPARLSAGGIAPLAAADACTGGAGAASGAASPPADDAVADCDEDGAGALRPGAGRCTPAASMAAPRTSVAKLAQRAEEECWLMKADGMSVPRATRAATARAATAASLGESVRQAGVEKESNSKTSAARERRCIPALPPAVSDQRGWAFDSECSARPTQRNGRCTATSKERAKRRQCSFSSTARRSASRAVRRLGRDSSGLAGSAVGARDEVPEASPEAAAAATADAAAAALPEGAAVAAPSARGHRSARHSTMDTARKGASSAFAASMRQAHATMWGVCS
mmetsp:Transcript_689/g.2750  ORF Transcript_689/g.2750 Transcript_689/m.2750 type:complete len:311 (+) Transcript_689:141-1073(+)